MKHIASAASLVVLLFAVGAQAQSQKTIIGTGTHPTDVEAVQNAVDNYDIVALSGTFNFGQVDWGSGTPAGMVTITHSNVLLKADERTGATIIGGGAPSDVADWTWPVISIRAPGITVRGLTMRDSADTGIFVSAAWSALPTGNTITLENNNIAAPWVPILSIYRGGWPLVVRNNTLKGIGGIWDIYGAVTLDENYQLVQRSSKVDILDNDVTADGSAEGDPYADGIVVNGWPVFADGIPANLPPGTNPADWGDNEPVTIIGNTVTATSTYWDAIALGRDDDGVNHGLVAQNTVRGKACGGVTKYEYGHDNLIIGNDLTGFEANCYSIGVFAPDTTVTKNILGTVVPNPISYNALLIMSANGEPGYAAMPLPVENCTIMDNDYRHSNCPGLSQGGGCILIASEADLQSWTGVGTEVRNNLIKETGKFPVGTGGPNNQILELKVGPSPLVHDNRIVGLPTNYVPDPGIGQRIKGARRQILGKAVPFDFKILKKRMAP